MAESSPPDDTFVWDLWARLVKGEDPQSTAHTAHLGQRGETCDDETEQDDVRNLESVDRGEQKNR